MFRLIPLLAIVSMSCCAGPACTMSKHSGPPTVILTGEDGKTLSVKVEVASRLQQQRQGLMFRQNLAPDAGMLFVYPADGPRYFWMKNTYIPLDMLFIGNNMRIVGIIERAQPLTTTKRSVELPSRFVLEVNGGFAQKHGIKVGSPVRLENIPGI